jgi:hypothetical protein
MNSEQRLRRNVVDPPSFRPPVTKDILRGKSSAICGFFDVFIEDEYSNGLPF